MSPRAKADDFTIEFTTFRTIVLTIILAVVGTIFFKNLSVVGFQCSERLYIFSSLLNRSPVSEL